MTTTAIAPHPPTKPDDDGNCSSCGAPAAVSEVHHPPGATLHLGGSAWAHPDLEPLVRDLYVGGGPDLVEPRRVIGRHPENPRKGEHAALVKSLGDHGIYSPVKVQRSTGYVCAGNHTLDAAIDHAAMRLPWVWLDVDDDEARAIMLDDNHIGELGGYDDRLLLEAMRAAERADQLARTSYTVDDRDALERAVAAADAAARRASLGDPDELPDRAGAPPITAAGDVWQLGSHTLVCGDSTSSKLYGQLAPVDLTFTSFPYGVGLDYGEDVPADDFDQVRKLLGAVSSLLYRATRPGGYVVTNFADVIAGRQIAGVEEPCEYPAGVDYWAAFRAAGWLLHSRRIWAKPHARTNAPWTANSNRGSSDWEHLWSWRKPGRHLNQRREHSAYGVWDTSRLEGVEHGKEIHPAAFPVSLAELVLEVHSNPGDHVLDTFAGTGTVLVAAERTGRRSTAFELSRSNCDLICHRFEHHTGIVPVRAGVPVSFTD
jgi:DNA modification methylase